MLNQKLFVIILPMLLSFSLIPLSFGHGVGGETLPPIDLGDRSVTVHVNVEPPIDDPLVNNQIISIKF